MPKKCKRCGTVNDSDARYCKACQNPFSSRAGGGGKSLFCKKCNEQRRVKGKTKGWFTPPGPIDQYEEEWEYYALECPHPYLIRKTGRERPCGEVRL